ncbi:hypothetical protein [uncultured Chryseobacterium sp.]|uniref:hypothetical protein n=1 Tax=uncultured Chryseobacterium sp. TaxID=259322 RepID=UPI00260ACFFB|nr:hypothetical protein [uncultured Chryseobacterium sp.]
MKEKHVPYSYQKVVPWILIAFLFAVVTPPLVAPFRYGSLRWMWQVGLSTSFLLIIFVNIAVIINAVFTVVEFRLTGKYNWFWFVFGLIPLLYYLTLFMVAILVPSPDVLC